jgi:rubrerythrin
MNFANILHQIAQADPEFYERVSPRRRVIARWMPKVALSALPFALGSLFNKAYGQNTDVVINTLNFALKLEMLESRFYETALTRAAAIIPSRDLPALRLMSANEAAHREFVRNTIIALGATPIAEPRFDFTGGNGLGTGPYADVFINYTTLLAISQTFEETGVRAYKGSAPNLMSNNDVLQAALQIHSVEARHAAMVRKMRHDNGHTTAKPWITGAQSGIASMPSGPTWEGEENTVHAGIAVTASVSQDAATEAFDEPLSMAQVEAIADPFIAF